MLDKVLNALVKRAGLDKYVKNVTLTPDTRPYFVTLGTKTKSITVWFEVQEEYKDEVELALSFLP